MALSFAVTPFMFPPDWSDDVLEHLEWRTDVLTAHDETEQRRSLRTKARRSFEYTLHATADRAPELEGLLFTKQNARVAVPVWTDRARSTSSIAIGGTVVSVPTANYAFASSQLVCFYVSETQYEFCRIAFVDSTSLTFDTPMASAWPAGTLIFPAVLAMLPKDVAVTRYTSNALTCRVELTTSPDITYAFTPTDQTVFAAHNGLEVVLTQPNWRAPISNTFGVRYDVADGGTGAIVQMQTAPLSRRTHQYAWLLKNRAEILAYRNFLGRCKGQFKSFYVPSWHDDMRILSVAPGNTSVTVAGKAWIGAGFNAVAIYAANGSVAYRNCTIDTSGTDTLVTLDRAAPFNIAKIRLLCPTRMLGDKVTLNWKSDSVVEVTNAMITGFGIKGSGDYSVGDPYWSDVLLLLPFESDTNDVKGHSKVTTGTPVLDATNNPAPYGTNSVYFGGNSRLRFDMSVPFNGKLTVECYLRTDDLANANDDIIHFTTMYGYVVGFGIGTREYDTAPRFRIHSLTSGNGLTNLVVQPNTDYHVAWQFTGTHAQIYVNGVLQALDDDVLSIRYPTIENVLVGGYDATPEWGKWRLKSVRITLNQARYSADFTPPALPYPES